jgi:zinc D-Ala-D-Ala carboxypeptidase
MVKGGKMTQLTPHFTLAEMTTTSTGISNVPNDEQLADLIRLCSSILEPMRELTGPLTVNSGFRSTEVNHAIGGANKSQHMAGQAADVI